METKKIDAFRTDESGKRALRSFSLAERDRRYAQVRQLMAERGLDALLAPATDVGEAQANSRYLSQIGGVQGGAWVVFPASGEATAIVAAEREWRMWSAHLVWPKDLRWGNFSQLVPDRVKELGLERSRIGVIGLVDQYMRPEGVIPYETWRRITAALPDAQFVPANDVLEFARVIKGPEEIDVIERITAANEDAIARMMEVARPGVEEATVWIEMAKVLIEHTADYPARLSLGSNGRPANASNTMALPIAMEDGGVLSQEIDARLQGYRAQSNHSILIGTRNAEAYRSAMEVAIETYAHLLEWIRPGKTIGEFLDEFVRFADSRRAKAGGVIIHTNGLGQDRPRVGPGPDVKDRDMVIRPGFTFSIKPQVEMKATGVRAQVGDPLTVTDRGARRLGRRKLEPFVTG
ncbi:MAG TPA: M24 family metallopeptidase [Candidatus Acidoferrales bacterium]|nr:M24 family metallopeptidase [Candidatus Acidoferrales bacterium]